MSEYLVEQPKTWARQKKQKKKQINDLLLDPVCLAAGEMSGEILEEQRRAPPPQARLQSRHPDRRNRSATVPPPPLSRVVKSAD